MKQAFTLLAAMFLFVYFGGVARAGQTCTRDVHGVYQAESNVQWSCRDDEYNDVESHPLRLAAYLLHPVGFAAEWLIMRPFHFVVSQPSLAPVFGYNPRSEQGLRY